MRNPTVREMMGQTGTSAAHRNDISVGLGPVNFRIGKGQKLLNWEDNAGTLAANAVGLTHTLAALPFHGGRMKIDWRNLTPVYGGGLIDLMQKKTGTDGFSAWAMASGDPSYPKRVMEHEGTHLWMQRAMGTAFVGSYLINGTMNVLAGRNFYEDNYFEVIPYNDPF